MQNNTRTLLAVTMTLLAVISVHAYSKAPNTHVVMTDKGAVLGAVHKDVLEFKGIPYAQPPVGILRWDMPKETLPWNSVKDATKYGTICPQLERYGIPESSDNEDCLSLNVTVPYKSPADLASKRPVIVWIHGGAFVGGSSALYPLDEMARAGDVVVVSMNYRLGVFGFVAHPSFKTDHDGGYGLEDQREAFRWVKRNIAAFGGDPDNVTIAGESAGGASVCMHLLAPNETNGLFSKAIVQSAGCVTPLPSVKEGNEIGKKVAALVGCSDDSKALSCLRKLPVKDLLDAASKVAGSSIVTFMPVIGAKTVPLPGAQAIPSGKFVHVPVLYGGTRDELRLYVAYAMQGGQKITNDNYTETLKSNYGDNAATIAAEYPASNYSSAATALGTAWSDFRSDVGINNCIYLETSKLLRKKVPIYQFVFADRGAPPVTQNPGFEMGAVHSSELPYQFPHYDNTQKIAGPKLAPASLQLAKTMMKYWTSFARSGVPSAPDAPVWEKFTSDDKVMNLEPGKMGLFNSKDDHKCTFWKQLYPKILTQ